MAAEQAFFIVFLPEVRLAQRLLCRRGLVPRIDVEALLREFADLEFVTFPENLQIDGLCLGLKAPGRRPCVLVNKNSGRTRQRFTLAHELGHVLIPWHIGNIVDAIDLPSDPEPGYFFIEAEANRFASELLMPTDWIIAEFPLYDEPLEVLYNIAAQADVSHQAAAIKLIDILPQGYAIACSRNNQVVWSSRSKGTLAGGVKYGVDLRVFDPYPFNCISKEMSKGITAYKIWRFPTVSEVTFDGPKRPWRQLLDAIAVEIITGQDEIKKFKSSVNGVSSSANANLRVGRVHGAIVAALIQRLHARAIHDIAFKNLVHHPSFHDFCVARALDFLK